jgi:hypothetical protein
MKLLSTSQKTQLGIAANAAYTNLEALDLLDLPGEVQTCSKSKRVEFWRQREVMHSLANTRSPAAESGSFREMRNEDYKQVHDRFTKLAGGTPKAKPSTPAGFGFLQQLMQAAAIAGLHENYVKKMAFSRYKTTDLTSLGEWQLKKLMFSVNNRSSAKRGVGSTKNRNKSQHAKNRVTKDRPLSDTWEAVAGSDKSQATSEKEDATEAALAWLEAGAPAQPF